LRMATQYSHDDTSYYPRRKTSTSSSHPPSSSGLEFLTMLFNKWAHYLPLQELKNSFFQPPFNSNDFFLGMRTAYDGFYSSWNNPKIKDTYWGLIRTVGASMLLLYTLAFFGMIFFLPILVFFPGWIWQVLSLIPLWSYAIAKRRNPLSTTRLFLDELSQLDPKLADQISSELPQNVKQLFNSEWVRSVSTDFRTSWHFVKLSTLLLALSAIPFVGPIVSFIGQYYLIADKLGWELMSTYTQAVKRMDYKQTREWIHSRKWAVIGFALPFALLSSIPFGGPLLLGYAQAAAAHLFVKMFGKEQAQSVRMTQG